MRKLPKKSPQTLDEAVQVILGRLSAKDRLYIQLTKDWAPTAHFELGMRLRNHWGFWKKEPAHLRLWFAKNLKVAHPDDMSGTILSAVEAAVKGKSFNPKRHVSRYRKHWKKYGQDPLVGDSGPIKP